MTLAKLDKRLGDLDARADDLVARMHEAAIGYLKAITPWVAGRFESDVAAGVTGAPDVTADLGADGMRRLRAGLDDLRAGTPDLVAKLVGGPGAWPHRWERASGAIAEGLYGAGADEVLIPPFLDRRLRLLLGTSGRLLARHGYERYVRRTFNRAYVRSDYFPPEYLARELEGHDSFHPLLAEYGSLCDKYADVLGDLRTAARDRSVRLAQDLWKQ
jgi:hypothetical protein